MKTALIIGASRGIGQQIAKTFAVNGYQVGVAAKTVHPNSKLPGTIHSVTEDIRQLGGKAIPIHCDVRDETQIQNAIDTCLEEWGSLDTLVYNAGAIMWKPVKDTPLKKFELLTQVNVRGAYAAIQGVLPHFMEKNKGKIILVSPPIYSRFFKGKTPYSVGKIGQTILTLGLGHELKNTGICVSSLWPATGIESQVTVKFGTPNGVLRKATIFADACLAIAQAPDQRYNAQALIDEDLLRGEGVTDFAKYRCDPEVEPPRMMPQNFPCLLVDEEEETVFASHVSPGPKSKL